MNPKFYNLPKDKQTKILNAAYKVFALNEYKKAPMSQIADECSISKSLLFHYFKNKLELYMYLWNQALELNATMTKEYRVYETDDFFEMLECALKGKCSLMRKHPYLTLFCMNAYYEKEEAIQKEIQNSFDKAKNIAFEKVSNSLNYAGINNNFSFFEVYQEILYASDGYILEQYRLENLDVDKIEKGYMERISFWKRAFGG